MNTLPFKKYLVLAGAAVALIAGSIGILQAADNVSVTAGSGTSVAADDVSSVLHQLIKLEYGTDGTATMVSTTNPLPVLNYNVEKAEDAAHTTADKGLVVLGVRNDAGTALATTTGDYIPFSTNANGDIWTALNAAIPAGTNNIGDVDVLSVILGTGATNGGKAEDAAHTTADTGILSLFVVETTNGGTTSTDGDYGAPTVNAGGATRVANVAQSQEGWSMYSNIDIDETTATTTQQMKASSGVLHSCNISNNTAATALYVKFYDATSLTGSAAGTETPVITIPIAGAHEYEFTPDYFFATGMTVAATTGVAVADTGAPAANAIVINCSYK